MLLKVNGDNSETPHQRILILGWVERTCSFENRCSALNRGNPCIRTRRTRLGINCKVYGREPRAPRSDQVSVVQPLCSESAMRGRKPKAESQGTRFRASIAEWKRTPAFVRPSLRALAFELGTSHQLLSFYLKNLHKWQSKKYWRQAKEIRSRAKWRPPRPWRSKQESRMIRRFVFQWFICRGKKPSGRNWTRQLGVSHTWLQKLVRKFTADSSEMWRLQATNGDPKFAELTRAQEHSRQMSERGELRGDSNLTRRAKLARIFERY